MAVESRRGTIALLRSEYGFWVAFFGTPLSAFALFSVSQRIFKVGLAPFLQEALEFYRGLYYPLFRLAASYFLALFPFLDLHSLLYWLFMGRETYQDLTALALVSALALLRAIVVERLQAFEQERASLVRARLEQERAELEAKLGRLPPASGDITWMQSLADRIGIGARSERKTAERKLRRTGGALAKLNRGGGGSLFSRESLTGLEPLVEGYLLLAFAAAVCGFTLLGLLLPFLTMLLLRSQDEAMRRINRQYLASLVIAVGAAGAVYVTNGLLK